MLVATNRLTRVEIVNFFPGDARAVEVHGALHHDVFIARGRAALRVDGRVVDDVQQLLGGQRESFGSGPVYVGARKRLDVGVGLGGSGRVRLPFIRHVCQKAGKILAAALREELVFGIVMMDAVAEEDALGIHHEGVPVRTFTRTGVIGKDILYRVADREIEAAVLVPGDVPAQLGGFGEMVDVFLLLQAQVLPARDLIAHDAQVRD